MNHKFKRFLFKWYSLFCVIAIFIAAVLLLPTSSWKEFAAIAAVMLSFAFGIQKQNLEETTLFKDLFEQFNKRYDVLNDELNRIYFDKQPADKPFTDDEREKLYKYFNICGEEWLYAERGFICPEVWRAWENGMKFFRQNPRIKRLWDEDLKDNDSYYGLTAEILENK
jgi:hypothetical protein